MSVKIFNDVAEQFLTSDDLGVLAIKGKWGVGKTFAWQRLVSRLSEKIRPSTYCYVSLFGLSSVRDIRNAMLGGVSPPTSSASGAEASKSWLSTILKRAQPWLAALAENKYAKGVSLSFEAIAPLLQRNMVVCLDDLERTGKHFSHDELMGFISTLRDTAGCKVVLILNEDKLTAEQTAYATYREKVIDQEITFEPTPDEALEWGVPSDLPKRDAVVDGARRLNIVNVRVLKKISHVVKLLSVVTSKLRPEVQLEVALSAVVIGWCHFDRSGFAPPLSFLRSWTFLSFKANTDDAKPTDEEIRWRKAVNDFRFMHFDELDAAIAKVVERGYLQDSGFEAEATKRSQLYAKGDLEAAFRGAWNLFHESYDADDERVIEALDGEARRCVMIVGPMDLDSTVGVLRALGKDDRADSLIDFYMKNRQGDRSLWDLSSNPFGREISDATVRRKFQEKLDTVIPVVSLREAIETVAENGGWSGQHERAVEAATVDDFYRLFKGPLSTTHRKAIEAAFRITSQRQQGDLRVMDALRRIATESPLNALRLSWVVRPADAPEQEVE